MLTLAGQLSKNEFSVYEVKCYFYVDEKSRTIYGWGEQNDEVDEKSRTIYGWGEQNDETRRTTLCGCSVYEVKCYLLQGFHLSLPCFGEETMLFWIMFICLYIYSNLLICYYNMLSDFNKNASHCKEIEIYWSEILF